MMMKLAYIPAGEFIMGNRLTEEEIIQRFEKNQCGYDSGHLVHQVQLSRGFFMGETDVTRGQFAEFINQTHYVKCENKHIFLFPV